LSLALRPKAYLRPQSEAELAEILQKYGDAAKIIAGGTGIYELANRGLFSEVEALIDIAGLDLSYVKREGNSLRIGAATTMTSLGRAHQELKGYSAIIDALNAIQPLQVKNVATIGGAICSALPFFDLPVALLSLGAEVCIAPNERRVRLSDFIQGYFSVDLQRGEFVKEIELGIEKGKKTASAFQKFGLTHDDWAMINCGVSISLEADKTVSSATIFFGGGVPDKPKRAPNMEQALLGLELGNYDEEEANNEARIKQLFEESLAKDLEPISDFRGSSEYRLRLAKVLGRRTCLQALKRIFSQ
jgi:carbon-monoxide dehydrogenase medium subunit